MQIEVPLTLTIELPPTATSEDVALYLDPTTGAVSADFLADLMDDGIPDMMIYGGDKVLKVCGKTLHDIRLELSQRIP